MGVRVRGAAAAAGGGGWHRAAHSLDPRAHALQQQPVQKADWRAGARLGVPKQERCEQQKHHPTIGQHTHQQCRTHPKRVAPERGRGLPTSLKPARLDSCCAWLGATARALERALPLLHPPTRPGRPASVSGEQAARTLTRACCRTRCVCAAHPPPPPRASPASTRDYPSLIQPRQWSGELQKASRRRAAQMGFFRRSKVGWGRALAAPALGWACGGSADRLAPWGERLTARRRCPLARSRRRSHRQLPQRRHRQRCALGRGGAPCQPASRWW